MSPVTHFLIGWTVANLATDVTPRERGLITGASVVPDVDGLGIIAEWMTRGSSHPLNWFSEYHHTLHNLTFALCVAAFAMAFARGKMAVGVLVLISFHFHLLGDLIGARGPDGDQWPMKYLAPFSDHPTLSWSGQWALNSWRNVVLTGALVIVALRFAWSRGYSPVGLFSQAADAAVVDALRRRFGAPPLQARAQISN